MNKKLPIPCECGCQVCNVLHDRFGAFHLCLIGCSDILCNEAVVRVGLTERQAERRAKRAWNRRMKGAKMND